MYVTHVSQVMTPSKETMKMVKRREAIEWKREQSKERFDWWICLPVVVHYSHLCQRIRSINWMDPKKELLITKYSLKWPLASLKLKEEAKNPKGKAPIPKDIWMPPSPKPKPGKFADEYSGSVLCPGGRGGSLSLGSWREDPLPYKGMTLSLEMAALQTGQTWRFGFVSNHWWRHGQLFMGKRRTRITQNQLHHHFRWGNESIRSK